MSNDMGGLNLGDLLKGVMDNPEMLKNAMDLAGKLKDNPEFKNIFSGMATEKEAPALVSTAAPSKKEEANENAESVFNQIPRHKYTEPEKGFSQDDKKYSPKPSDRVKLLNALKPYLGDERKEKIDFILKILNLLELAQGMGLKNLL